MKRHHGFAKCEVWIDGLQHGHARLGRGAAGHNHGTSIGGGQMRGVFAIGQKCNLTLLGAVNWGAGMHQYGAIPAQRCAYFFCKFIKSDSHGNRKPSNQL